MMTSSLFAHRRIRDACKHDDSILPEAAFKRALSDGLAGNLYGLCAQACGLRERAFLAGLKIPAKLGKEKTILRGSEFLTMH
jgi:hypothetical protein